MTTFAVKLRVAVWCRNCGFAGFITQGVPIERQPCPACGCRELYKQTIGYR